MSELDYYTRQRSRFAQLTERGHPLSTARSPWVTFYRDGLPALSPLERMELESLRRELAVLVPGGHL